MILVLDSDSSHNEIDALSQLSSQHSPSNTSTAENDASPLHKYATEGNFDLLRKLILEHEADVNLPLKDGSTPLLRAAERGHDGMTYVLSVAHQTVVIIIIA